MIAHTRFGGPRGGVFFDSQARPNLSPTYLYAPEGCGPYGQTQGLYCLPLAAAPPLAFATPETYGQPAYGGQAYGWSHDGYDRGYQADGSPVPIAAPPPPRRGFFGRPAY